MEYSYSCRSVSLLELCDVERAKAKKCYPKGSCYIQISACRRKGLEQFKMLHTNAQLESRYAVVIPKIKIYSAYLLIALNNSADEFMHKYVGTNINIQIENFGYFKMLFHDDYNEQKHIAEQFEVIEKLEEYERQQIKKCEDIKKWSLDNLFV